MKEISGVFKLCLVLSAPKKRVFILSPLQQLLTLVMWNYFFFILY